MEMRFKQHPGVGGRGHWTNATLPEFLLEYDELVQALLARPEYRFVIDAELAEITSLRTWRGKTLSKYSPRRRKPGV